MSQYSEIVCDLLQSRRAEPSATEVFKHWKHDADLCPKLRNQIEAIFSGFKKYHTVSYDIQGLKDQGTDVLLIEWVDDQKEFVCFQVKGEWDLAQNSYLQTLKAQYFDTRTRYGSKLKAYYILVCYSIVAEASKTGQPVVDKARKEKVKGIIREFALETNVRVVEPEYAAWFLSLNTIRIDAIIRSRFGDQDVVFKEARNLVRDLGVMEKIILLFILWLHLFHNKATVTADEIIHSPDMQRLHQRIAEQADDLLYDFDYQIAHDLETLQNNFVECDSTGGFSLPLQSVQPLAILMMDGSVRYNYQDAELLEYTLRILGGFDLSDSD
jgi:hypothetical protein